MESAPTCCCRVRLGRGAGTAVHGLGKGSCHGNDWTRDPLSVRADLLEKASSYTEVAAVPALAAGAALAVWWRFFRPQAPLQDEEVPSSFDSNSSDQEQFASLEGAGTGTKQ